MALYACSDLHGRFDLYEKICKYIKPEDTVYFLGDANDRGPQGWALIKEIYNNPQFIYLKGNHEDILYKALVEYFDTDYSSRYWYDMSMRNGGYQTFYDAINDFEVREWIKKLCDLPYTEKVKTKKGKIILCHSGDPYGTKKDMLWSRQHFNCFWPKIRNVYIVHGHTPTPYLQQELTHTYFAKHEVVFYAQKHKIDIDVGACWRNYTCLLNLDTFEVIKLNTDKQIINM